MYFVKLSDDHRVRYMKTLFKNKLSFRRVMMVPLLASSVIEL